MPPFLLLLTLLLGWIATPLASRSSSLVGQVLFSARDFLKEFKNTIAKLKNAIPSRKMNTRSSCIYYNVKSRIK